MARINLDVNGKVQTIDADADMPLLYALRNDLGLNNPHFGKKRRPSRSSLNACPRPITRWSAASRFAALVQQAATPPPRRRAA